MPDPAPWDVVGAVRDASASGVFRVEDPQAVADELVGGAGVAVVEPEDLASALAGVRVRLAEALVERARHAEAHIDPAPATASAPTEDDGPDADADRQAIRFALLVLVPALVAGIVVHVVDGLWLASALPAAALVLVGIVVLVHRRSPEVLGAGPVTRPDPPASVDDAPAVRAAGAHLRRQQAAWKVSWWERRVPVPDLDRWLPATTAQPPFTLVVVDRAGTVDERAHATMTATAPAAVRLVVLRSRS